MFIRIRVSETLYELLWFRSQILVCHILLAYIKVRTRSDQTTRRSSSYCIMLLFVNAYNAQCHVPQYVGGKLSHPACVFKAEFLVQTGIKGYFLYFPESRTDL